MSERFNFSEEFFQKLEEFRLFVGTTDESHPLYQVLHHSKQITDDCYFVTELGDGWKDIIAFVKETKKESKQLKEDIKLELKNSADLTRRMNKYYSESKNLKQKLEQIQKLVNDKDFLVTRRQLVDILKDSKE